jgi:hypothetical protein
VKGLQITNAVVLAFGAAMGIVLGVVCVLVGVHADSEPQLRAQLPRLFLLTGLFLALAATGGVALLGQRRGWPGRWLLQALPLAPVAGLGAFLLSLRG